MSFRPLFGQITILSLSFVTFRVSRFHVSHLTHETFKLGLQNTLNMSKTTRVHFGVLQIYPAQGTQPKESDQLRLECHQGLSARSLVARFDEVVYSAHATQPKESDQLRLERHQGLSARSPVARFDEVIYSAQATQPKE